MFEEHVDYDRWCDDLVEIMRSRGRVRGMHADESAREFVERCRGDEPSEVFDLGDSPEAYADFISEEDDREGNTGLLEEADL